MADARRQSFEKPNVRTWAGQIDVTQTLATNLCLRHFHAAFVADHAAMLHAFVFAAETFPISHRTKDARAEKPVTLRLERAVVDRLRLWSPRHATIAGSCPATPARYELLQSQELIASFLVEIETSFLRLRVQGPTSNVQRPLSHIDFGLWTLATLDRSLSRYCAGDQRFPNAVAAFIAITRRLLVDQFDVQAQATEVRVPAR